MPRAAKEGLEKIVRSVLEPSLDGLRKELTSWNETLSRRVDALQTAIG
jgi:hypothetical protein